MAQRAAESRSYYSGKLLLTLRQDSQGKVTAAVRQMIQLEKSRGAFRHTNPTSELKQKAISVSLSTGWKSFL